MKTYVTSINYLWVLISILPTSFVCVRCVGSLGPGKDDLWRAKHNRAHGLQDINTYPVTHPVS